MARPRIYKDPAKFDAVVDSYVEDCREEGEPITITGLCLALKFSSKGTLYEYQNYPEFSESVKRARQIVENAYEIRLAKGEQSAAGPIFALKNFGWTDRMEVDQTVRGAVSEIEVRFVDEDE